MSSVGNVDSPDRAPNGAPEPPRPDRAGSPFLVRCGRGFRRRAVLWLAVTLAVLLGLVLLLGLAGGLWVRSRLVASLPVLDAEIEVAGLAAPVAIERDRLGIPTIHGSSRSDVAFATGFVHAQDRFFQMDLLRRRAAGELSELLGEPAVEVDGRVRIHLFRALARRVVGHSTPEVRAVLDAYSRGVNAGLAALDERPPEYLLLGAKPKPWSAEDSALVLLSMFLQLQSQGVAESRVGLLQDLLPRPLAEFLMPEGTTWDAPILGEPLSSPPVPGPEVFDLRRLPRVAQGPPREGRSAAERHAMTWAGSNAWAVGGSHTRDGGALVATDLHLGLSVPNIWYRASLSWPAEDGRDHLVTGATLPGTPFMVVGSNAHVAWGLSNSLADTSDVVLLDLDPKDDATYLTPSGPRRFERHREAIRVKGGVTRTLGVEWTQWGPVIDRRDHRGRKRALRWIVHEKGAVDFGILGLETSRHVEEALAVAQESGAPALNFVVADAQGRIAWTILGKLPRRIGFDGRSPGSWAHGGRRWAGLLPPAEVPRVVDPASGRVWTANNRVVGGEMLDKLGHSGYLPGARARQIRDGLLALDHATPRDMLAIQLDARAVFLERWQELLLSALTPEAVKADPRRRELRDLVERWGGVAAIDSAGYRMVRSFRLFLAEDVFAPLIAPCRQVDPELEYIVSFEQFEGPLWRLVSERPVHLLDPRYATWDEQLLASVDRMLDSLDDSGPLRERVWGERNTTSIRHPFSRAIPGGSRWLDMPPLQLPGDNDMPRIQHPAMGASLRMVVAPGREHAGIFHMPVGQSGHPLSPHYADGHAAWARGEETPFLPGPAVHTLRLAPPQ